MRYTMIACLISLGITCAGVIWIVAGGKFGSPVFCFVIGVPVMVIGLINLLVELRDRTD